MTNIADAATISIDGRCEISYADTNEVILNKHNAIHPQNMARIIGRALANEPNSCIYRMAFGNGGTSVDAAYTITYRPANDGQSPDVATWDSRLYNETYSEVVDEGRTGAINPQHKMDLGSADNYVGFRRGGGSVPHNDVGSVPHVSGPGVRSIEMGLKTEVLIECQLNADEPVNQTSDDGSQTNTEHMYMFDEIGLYSKGSGAIDAPAHQRITFTNGPKTSESVAPGLVGGQHYKFAIITSTSTNNPTIQVVEFTTPAGGTGPSNSFTFGDFCEAFNTRSPSWVGLHATFPANLKFEISDSTSGTYPTISGANTGGALVLSQITPTNNTQVSLVSVYSPNYDPTNVPSIMTFINGIVTASDPQLCELQPPVLMAPAGLQNAPSTPDLERERLLAHLRFTPIYKPANRSLVIRYYITIGVMRTSNTNVAGDCFSSPTITP